MVELVTPEGKDTGVYYYALYVSSKPTQKRAKEYKASEKERKKRAKERKYGYAKASPKEKKKVIATEESKAHKPHPDAKLIMIADTGNYDQWMRMRAKQKQLGKKRIKTSIVMHDWETHLYELPRAKRKPKGD